MQDEAYVAIAAQALALSDAQRGNVRRAATLPGFVDAVYERRGAQREPTEATVCRRVAELLAAGDPQQNERQMQRGRDLDVPAAWYLAVGNAARLKGAGAGPD